MKGVRDRVILDVNITVCETQDAAIDKLEATVLEEKRVKVAFANANLLRIASGRKELRFALTDFIVLNDGIAIDSASVIAYGSPFPCNLNGTDFTPAFLRRATASKIFLFGARPGVVERAALEIGRSFPEHKVVGFSHGYIDESEHDALCAEIKRLGADILLVGMGNPRQELWIDKYLEATGCRYGLAIGAYFDFASHSVSRAPSFIRAIRAEWLYRLYLEPKRLARRYSIETVHFFALVIRERFLMIKSKS